MAEQLFERALQYAKTQPTDPIFKMLLGRAENRVEQTIASPALLQKQNQCYEVEFSEEKNEPEDFMISSGILE